MKKIIKIIGAIVVVSLLSVGISFSAADPPCMRPGKGKTVEGVFYCPYEAGIAACYYKINCDDVGDGGGGTQ